LTIFCCANIQEDDDGMGGSKLSVRPYLMDLASTNGVRLNGEKIDDMRYYELKEKVRV
jgi:smad nuclear-interacting protein 1